MAVINDFEALGYGIPLLEDDDLLVLNDVPAVDKVELSKTEFHCLSRDSILKNSEDYQRVFPMNYLSVIQLFLLLYCAVICGSCVLENSWCLYHFAFWIQSQNTSQMGVFGLGSDCCTWTRHWTW